VVRVNKEVTFSLDRCVRCSAPAQGPPLRRDLLLPLFHPMMLVLGWLLYPLVVLGVGAKARIWIGLCSSHWARRRWGIRLFWAGAIGFLTLVAFSTNAVVENEMVSIARIVTVGCLIYGFLASRIIASAKVNDLFVWIKGVSREAMEDLPEIDDEILYPKEA